MFNKVVMVGNLTRDIELKYLPSGSAVAKCALACNRKYKKTDGTQAEEVCFIDIDIFGRTAEVAQQYLRKGSKILIEGRLKLDTWKDQSGQNRQKHSILVESLEMLDGKAQGDNTQYSPTQTYGNQNANQSYGNQPQSQSQGATKQNIPSIDVDADIANDDIPF